MAALLEQEQPVLPPVEPLGELADLLSHQTGQITLSKSDGTHLVLPGEVFDVLKRVVKALAAGQAVIVAPIHQRLTTQQAADLLGISRPTFVKLLESGEIDYEQPGRHRRVLLTDVLDYRQRRSTKRREGLDRMVEIAEESGMYERTTGPPNKVR